MSVYKPKGTPFYHYDFQYRGDRFHGSTETADRRKAETIEKAERAKVKEQHVRNSRKAAQTTLDEAVGRYWDEVGRHSSETDLEENLARLVTLLGETTTLAELDDDRLAKAIAERRKDTRAVKGGKRKPISAARVNRTMPELLRRIMMRASKIWKIPLPDEPSWSDHMLKEPTERVREMSFDEEAKIEDAERDDYRPARLFAQATGLRRREVVSLTWPQVDWGAGVIRVVQKGDQPHTIPITPEITGILWPLRGHHETAVFTFVAQRTKREVKSGRSYVKGQRYPITYNGWGTAFGRTIGKAGVKDFRMHDLRHTGATRTLRASKNIRAVQHMLGHKDVKTTMRYAHAMKDDVAEAMEARVTDEARRRADYESRKSPEVATKIKISS